jgi:hypothetical protein
MFRPAYSSVQFSFVVDVVELIDTTCHITALLCMAKSLNCSHVISQKLSSTSCTWSLPISLCRMVLFSIFVIHCSHVSQKSQVYDYLCRFHDLQRCFGLIHNVHCNGVYRKGANVRNYISCCLHIRTGSSSKEGSKSLAISSTRHWESKYFGKCKSHGEEV